MSQNCDIELMSKLKKLIETKMVIATFKAEILSENISKLLLEFAKTKLLIGKLQNQIKEVCLWKSTVENPEDNYIQVDEEKVEKETITTMTNAIMELLKNPCTSRTYQPSKVISELDIVKRLVTTSNKMETVISMIDSLSTIVALILSETETYNSNIEALQSQVIWLSSWKTKIKHQAELKGPPSDNDIEED